LHVCHKNENFVKLDELLARYCLRDYIVVMGEFSYACYRMWRFVKFLSVVVSAVEFQGVGELVKGVDHFLSHN
jgi:hypothetical protein